MLNTDNPAAFYPDASGGPLQGGLMYFGLPGQNPVTSPLTVFWDSAGTQPAAQPVKIFNGRTVRQDGTPARIWVIGDYSKLVQDASGRQVAYETNQPQPPTVQQSVTDRFSGTGAPATFTLSAAPADSSSLDVYVAGVYQQKSSYTLVGNQLTITAAAAANNIEAVTRNTLNYANVAQSIATSLASASGSATAAGASRAAIDNRIYPGIYAIAPTTRPDGSAIQNGDEYFGADGFTYVRVAGVWVNQTSAAAASAVAASGGANLAGLSAIAAAAAASVALSTAFTTSAAVATISDGTTWGWYENDTRYITKDGSNLVSAWADRLGSAHTLVQATGSKQPVWSATGIHTDGVDDFLQCVATLTQPVTIYLVVQQDDAFVAGSDYVIDGGGQNRMALVRKGTGYMNLFKGNYIPAGGTVQEANNRIQPGLPMLIILQFNGASSKLKINGKTTYVGDSGSLNGTALAGLTLGADGSGTVNFTPGYYKECIVRQAVDDETTTMATIGAYLMAKHRKEIPLYCVYGQSNAGGQALTANAPAGYGAAFANGKIWNRVNSAFETYDPTSNAQTTVNCFGPENALLRRIYARTGVVPYLLKYAIGNTALYPGANPGGGIDWYPDTAGGRFSTAMSDLAAAVAWLEPGCVVPIIKGTLWMQGESDSTNATWAAAYYANLTYFMRKLDAALVAATGQTSAIRYVVGEVHTLAAWPYTATVQSAQQKYGRSFGVAELYTDSYTLISTDQAHYDANGLVQLGDETADTLLRG